MEWVMMFSHITRDKMLWFRPWDGSSVARDSDASASCSRSTHIICTAFIGDDWRHTYPYRCTFWLPSSGLSMIHFIKLYLSSGKTSPQHEVAAILYPVYFYQPVTLACNTWKIYPSLPAGLFTLSCNNLPVDPDSDVWDCWILILREPARRSRA